MRRLAAVTIFAVLPFAPLFAAAERNDRAVTVMTRNMYFGADLTPATQAKTPEQLFAAVTTIFAKVRASDVPGRVDAVAAEIAATRPDLVGLQEVAHWSTSPPTVEFDFLQLLLAALAARGIEYTAVVSHVTNNLTAPGVTPAGIGLVHFVDREVILAKTGRHQNDPLTLSNPQTGTFALQAGFPLPTGGTYFESRGWVGVDVTARGVQFRFISTHLLPEGLADSLQEAQGIEVLAGPANTPLSVIYVCDCNSRADGTGTTTYATAIRAGFVDAWSARNPHDPGLTCCQAEDVLNPRSLFDQRIDLILIRGGAHVRNADQVGEQTSDRTASGHWPSDHAGVVATINLGR